MKIKLSWNFVNSIVLVAWIIVLFLNYCIGYFHNLYNSSLPRFFVYYNYFIYPFSILALVFCYKNSLKFPFYVTLVILWGLSAILINDYIFGIFLVLSSIPFFCRLFESFFSNYIRIFLLGTFELLICTVIIYYIGTPFNEIIIILIKSFAIFLILFVNLFVFYPFYINKAIEEKNNSLYQIKGLSNRQQKLFTEIINGEKYSYLAKKYNISEVTIKREVKNICQKLNVIDKTELIVKYGNISHI